MFLLISLFKDIKNLFDLSSPAKRAGKDFDLSEPEHLPPQPCILQEISRLRFESEDQTEFMDPPFRLNLIQDHGME